MSSNAKASQSPVLIKIGGRIAEEDHLITALAEEIRRKVEEGDRILLVHGGGVTITALQDRYGINPVFIDGLRQTSPKEMPLVDMALSGAVNKRLVRLFEKAGLKAWGLSGADGGVLRAESIGEKKTNRTGRVIDVDTRALETLWNSGYFPVLAPPATDIDGQGLNINADEAALALASALKADNLIFISDVAGVLEAGVKIPHLTPILIEEKITAGIVAGGMIPKTRSAADALKKGVRAVTIGTYIKPGDLKELLSGRSGTRIDTGRFHHA